MYCDLVFGQKIETWLRLHRSAFEFFGGVPAVIVPDNLKSAVIRAAFGAGDEVVLNRSYRELARHYGFKIDPTPPRAPQKKGKVERAGRYVKHNCLATMESVDINADRKALTRWNNEIAAKRRHGTTGKVPLDVFREQEQPALLPLPKTAYVLTVWKRARVHRDTHVQIRGAFYSVPWGLIGTDVWARCTKAAITIYSSDTMVCTHSTRQRGERATLPKHLPDHRGELRHRSRNHWTRLAEAMGPEVRELVDAVFDSDDVLHQLRKVQAIVGHLQSFPVARARAAARRALHFGCLEYGAIKNILRKGLDLEPWAEACEERAWSQGSRFARKPTEALHAVREKSNDHHQ